MKQIDKRLLSWASILDAKAEEQARVTSTMPFVFPHVALMPDAHLGLGATVGSVIPTLRAVMPAAVGVDIGCGMIAVRTQFQLTKLPKDLRALRQQIERAIPVSAGAHNSKIVATAEPRVAELERLAADAGFDPAQALGTWREQLGTLGSGNHFIEVSVDETDGVWLFLHSGSNVWLSRKGAISARAGELGLIPGSMGTASYVVEGLGNAAALQSSPHGAGRNFSRSAARRTFTHDQLKEAMKGIEYRDTDAFLDEIPAAYKPIDQIMVDAAELVKVRHELRQIVNVKGD